MAAESPVVLVKWYDLVKWFLERVDSFPKNQRFVLGQRMPPILQSATQPDLFDDGQFSSGRAGEETEAD